MKKMIAILSAIALCAGSVPVLPVMQSMDSLSITVSAEAIIEQGTCGENVSYTLDADGTLTISGTGMMKDYVFEEYSPFHGNPAIKKAVIDEGITNIGCNMFYQCQNLTSVSIPQTVESIGLSAFDGCSSLKDVQLPESITYLEDRAFSNCISLTEIILPKSMTDIGWYAFNNCTGLTEVVIPANVEYVGNFAFSYCTNLEKVTMYSEAYVGTMPYEDKFLECTKLKTIIGKTGSPAEKYAVFMGITFIPLEGMEGICGEHLTYTLDMQGTMRIQGTGAMYDYIEEKPPYDRNAIRKLILEDGVTSIGERAFTHDKNLDEVQFPDTLEVIGYAAFDCCEGLKTVTIPKSVKQVGNDAFANTGITEVEILGKDAIFGYHVFWCTPWLRAEQEKNPMVIVNDSVLDGNFCRGDIIVPDGVRFIAEKAFDTLVVTSVTIPASVTDIGDFAMGYDPYMYIKLEDFTVKGYRGTAAEAFAKKYEFLFIALDDVVPGDCNGDGKISLTDVIAFQKYLLNDASAAIVNPLSADLNADGFVNVFDFVLLKRMLMQG